MRHRTQAAMHILSKRHRKCPGLCRALLRFPVCFTKQRKRAPRLGRLGQGKLMPVDSMQKQKSRNVGPEIAGGLQSEVFYPPARPARFRDE